MIYMDYNATTPLAEDVIISMSDALRDLWGNPSSGHSYGKKARSAIDNSRECIARLISTNSNEIIFTSGGTEANNWIIHAAVERFYNSNFTENGSDYGNYKKAHIVTTTIEHDSIVNPIEVLKRKRKIDVSYVPVSKVTGHVLPNEVAAAVQPNTCLVTLMLANNETGVVQPVAEVVQAVRKKQNKTQSIICHTDAAQAIGKIPVDVNELLVDSLTIVGHKMYGPRIGALYLRHLDNQSQYPSLIYGGGQERGFRSGTENTVDIVGLGKAAQLAFENLDNYSSHMLKVKLYLEKKLTEEFGKNIHFNSRFNCEKSLPNTVNISLIGEEFKGSAILSECKKLAASSAAACHKDGKPSKILLSCGISEKIAANAIRLSVGRETNEADVDAAVEDLLQASRSVIQQYTLIR